MTLINRFFERLPGLSIIVLVALVAGCSGDDVDAYVERPVEELYTEATTALEAGETLKAARLFDEVERQHPYSAWATKAQLMAAYAYYENSYFDEAIAALNRFIQLHPTNRDAPYAHYLLALCYYEQISDITRDQSMTLQALSYLETVTKRYPNSKYAQDARLKIDLAYDHLAGKEMDVGRGQQRRGQCIAAINRFRNVVEKYQTTTHVPEALHRLTECYSHLGMEDEAKKTAAVLGHNFPGSEWYIDSYEMVEGKQVRPKEDKPWYKLW
ncbi:MAG: outer membrane protein assembly factor BamD [Rhodospirillales bacterium]|nr:outer membrane protein assembly factor BamD [Rhodospirillales bacterium]